MVLDVEVKVLLSVDRGKVTSKESALANLLHVGQGAVNGDVFVLAALAQQAASLVPFEQR